MMIAGFVKECCLKGQLSGSCLLFSLIHSGRVERGKQITVKCNLHRRFHHSRCRARRTPRRLQIRSEYTVAIPRCRFPIWADADRVVNAVIQATTSTANERLKCLTAEVVGRPPTFSHLVLLIDLRVSRSTARELGPLSRPESDSARICYS
jgi:hypothetical protein